MDAIYSKVQLREVVLVNWPVIVKVGGELYLQHLASTCVRACMVVEWRLVHSSRYFCWLYEIHLYMLHRFTGFCFSFPQTSKTIRMKGTCSAGTLLKLYRLTNLIWLFPTYQIRQTSSSTGIHDGQYNNNVKRKMFLDRKID